MEKKTIFFNKLNVIDMGQIQQYGKDNVRAFIAPLNSLSSYVSTAGGISDF